MIATDLKPELIADLKAKGVAETHVLDVLDSKAVKAMADKVGAINVLFNCAGFVHHGTVLTTSDAEWDFSFDLNVKSMHRTISAFLPAMLEERRRLDRQHRLRRLLGARHTQPLRLRRLEGGGGRPDQIGRRRLHQAGHPLQRHLPGHDRVAVPRRSHRHASQGAGQADRGNPPGLHRPPADGPARERRRRSPGSRSISPRTS